jgi:hypothetical protein
VSSREILIAGLDYKQAAGWGTAVDAMIAGTAAYGIIKADIRRPWLSRSRGGRRTVFLIHGSRGHVRVVPAEARGDLSRSIRLDYAAKAAFDVGRSERSG